MIEGDVVKAFVQQADGKYKPRPSVLIKKLPYFDDWLVCGISSKIHTAYQGLDIVITSTHPDFKAIGLNYKLIIRAGWLNAFPESKIEGLYGKISADTLEVLQNNISNYILQK